MKNNWLKIGGNYWDLSDIRVRRRDEGEKIFIEVYHGDSFYPNKVYNIGEHYIEKLRISDNCFRTKKEALIALKELKQGKRNPPDQSEYDGFLGEREFISYHPE